MRTRNSIRLTSIRFGSKSSAKRNRIFNLFFFDFFQIFMIGFGRIEQAICLNKTLDKFNRFNAKEFLTRVRFDRTES
jgi:hypothetical protein